VRKKEANGKPIDWFRGFKLDKTPGNVTKECWKVMDKKGGLRAGETGPPVNTQHRRIWAGGPRENKWGR